ncbi:MAG: DNA mismatch repair protein MutS [Candidatus Firestonebacteria bacterium]
MVSVPILDTITPMMKQYREIKKKYPEAILFFRLGDFYEMFFEDAKVASSLLQIVLTKRNSRGVGTGRSIPMCGIPYHAALNYITKLIKNGYKVAICEQVEDPKLAKGIVKREVVRLITPGTVIEDALLEKKANNFLFSLKLNNKLAGLSFVDVSTGEFLITEIDLASYPDKIFEEIDKFKPHEAVLPKSYEITQIKLLKFLKENNILIDYYEDYCFDLDITKETLLKHFKINSLAGFGVDDFTLGISCAGVVINYLQETQKGILLHINKLTPYNSTEYMLVDSSTRKNLELFERMSDKNQEGTLYWVIDKTVSPMGGRLLKRWILEPLLSITKIKERQEGVEELLKDYILRTEIRKVISNLSDIERISGKIGTKSANARDLIALKISLKEIPEIKKLLENVKFKILTEIKNNLDELKEVIFLVESNIEEEPPLSIKEGNIIKDGVNEELDKLRNISRSGKEWIVKFQEQERKRTGISSLKVGFTSVFGYYIEISRANLSFVPDNYTRKQTLTNAERFITQELKEYESLVLSSDEKINLLEYELFCETREKIITYIPNIQKNSFYISYLDSISSLSEVAFANKYIKPEINDTEVIDIKDGRHPVIELIVENGFVPNDTYLGKENQLIIVTGPNMAGKSTYLRQVALLSLLAQIGSFIPAKEAKIGIVDRIFTRVGASDNLALGHSTFMVEMLETANILNNATQRSLIILDEIGRGTATFDGISLAWAVAEYIHNKLGAKTLFATHFYELTELSLTLPRVKNYNILVKEWNDEIIFLRKIAEGAADRSYGIQVARLAGLPKEILNRAKEILSNLEDANYKIGGAGEKSNQLSVFEDFNNEIIEDFKKMDINKLTPVEALNKLSELKKKMKSRDSS